MAFDFVGVTNAIAKSISLPVLDGGACKLEFTVFGTRPAIGDFIQFRENLTVRFEGYITRISEVKTIENLNSITNYDCTAICKSYKLAAEVVEVRQNLGVFNDEFAGNGVELQEWLLRENSQRHVIWPPTGDNPIIFDETDPAVTLPANRVSIGEIEENERPSHVLGLVKRYIEKDFPCKADFDTDLKVTQTAIQKNPEFANYGRKFRILNPDDVSENYTESILQDARIGGTRFFVKDGVFDPAKSQFEKGNYVYGASINPRKTHKRLRKIGDPPPDPGEPDPPTKEFNNFCMVNMQFINGFRLPRVAGDHGVSAPPVYKQETYVRARMLTELDPVVSPVGGLNAIHRVGEFNHIEIEVKYDTFDGSKYRDWSFNGAPGLLTSDDEGGGIWAADLDGTWIYEDGDEKVTSVVSSAAQHYGNLQWTTDFEFIGLNWDQNFKIDYDTKIILLDSIDWQLSIDPAEQKTTYRGARLFDGISPVVERKKRMIETAEKKKADKKDNDSNTQTAETNSSLVEEFARVLWNWDVTDGDLSEGEFAIQYAGVWGVLATTCWIDLKLSGGVVFSEAGDDVIFKVILVEKDKARMVTGTGMVTRDLYKVVEVVSTFTPGGNSARDIAFLKTTQLTPNTIGRLVAKDTTETPWRDIETNGDAAASYIKTTILGTPKINSILFKLSPFWNGPSGDFAYLRLTPTNKRAHLMSFTAIRPVLKSKNPSETEYQSAETKVDTVTTIATYSKMV